MLVLSYAPDAHAKHAVEEFLAPLGTLVVARAVRAAAGPLEGIVDLPALLLPLRLEFADHARKGIDVLLHTLRVGGTGYEGCGG